MDEITITVLDDGRIKAETGPVSGPNHMNADKFLAWLQEQAGGVKSRQRRGSHSHDHVHHEHETEKH
jgi:hypothetical protein